MNIYMPDPHPGRCRNHRPRSDGTSVRCLDYENVEHVCTFPPMPTAAPNFAQGGYQTQREAKPWVKPS